MEWIVIWGLSFAKISSQHDSIHPPEMDINHPKTVWLPMWWSNNKIKKLHMQSYHPMELICQHTIAYNR